MRPCLFLLLLFAAVPSGCSYLVAMSGTDIQKMETRDEFRAKFGEPVEVGSVNGCTQEVFRTHRKLADTFFGPGESMAVCLTCGLSEFVTTPYELYRAAEWSVKGQNVVVMYDKSGKVLHRTHEGARYQRYITLEGKPQILCQRRPLTDPDRTLECRLNARLPIAAATRA
jgi:hypothetical protein